MIVLQGVGVGEDICIGRLKFLHRENTGNKDTVQDTDRELVRFEQACMDAAKRLHLLVRETEAVAGAQNAAIFEMQELLLSDEQFQGGVRQVIQDKGVSAIYAVRLVGEQLAGKMKSLPDVNMQLRAADILDVAELLVKLLTKNKEGYGTRKGEQNLWDREIHDQPCIIVADDLLPSEIVRLKKQAVGIVLRKGSVLSHVAILAKAMEIPTLFNVGGELSDIHEGKIAVLDGITGTLSIEPEEELLSLMRRKQEEGEKQKQNLYAFKDRLTETKDKKMIKLCANVGNMEQVETALENGAEGIGLFRSEQLFLERSTAPDEEEQFAIYRQVLECMQGKEVIIRTLDIGADKQVSYLNLPTEENPALGLRGIRLCLKRQELLKPQLRALFRAGVYGKLKIMYPMITSVDEVISLRQIEGRVKEELSAQGLAFDSQVPVGIMIETPAAALISDELAELVDFFSVGTNDLTQYTLAVDRQNGELAEFRNPCHKAVIHLLELTVANAHAAGIPVGICGELAADASMTEKLIRMGFDELSVPGRCILPLRQLICNLDLSDE